MDGQVLETHVVGDCRGRPMSADIFLVCNIIGIYTLDNGTRFCKTESQIVLHGPRALWMDCDMSRSVSIA